jgi:hypothetical protein
MFLEGDKLLLNYSEIWYIFFSLKRNTICDVCISFDISDLVIDGLVIGTSGKLFQLVMYNNLEIPIFYFLF